MIHALCALLLAAPLAQSAAPAGEIVIREALALTVDAPRSASRTLLRIDPVEYALITGTLGTPKDGALPSLGDGVRSAKDQRPWTAVTAGGDGVFSGERGTPAGDALSGGWFHATVDAPEAGVMMLVASGHGSVFVNGNPRGGDPYSWGFVELPVALRAGTNEFLFSTGRGRLAATLVPPPAPAFIAAGDVLVPDLVAGRDTDGPIGAWW
ncbi:MAG: hypothetical protein ACKOFI_02030 [Phycisphaerales bacterium]